MAAALLGCSGTDRPDTDSAALLACRDFYAVANEYETFTPDEFRSRLQDIDRNAKVSDETGIASSSRAMLVAATAGDDGDLIDAINAMNDACHAI